MAIKNYKRMKIILSVLFIALSYLTFSQKGFEEEIYQFYKDLNSGDSVKVKSYFLPTANIVHLDKDTVIVVSVDDFLTVCPKFKSKQYREEIVSVELVSWTRRTIRYKVHFKLFENDELIQCGIDEFTMLRYNTYNYFIDKIYSEIKNCDDGIVEPQDETAEELSERIDNI